MIAHFFTFHFSLFTSFYYLCRDLIIKTTKDEEISYDNHVADVRTDICTGTETCRDQV